jgi:phosphoribosylanthranilate isomerase
MKLKVCGMWDSQNIQDLLVLNPDYVGFIFYNKSPRNAIGKLNEELLMSFPSTTKKVGVFVDEELDMLMKIVSKYGLGLVQLHGDESPEYVSRLKDAAIPVIKVFSIEEGFDFNLLSDYEPFVDYFLFDTKGEQRGGTGKKFDWGLLKNYNQKTPFLLSGGVDLDDILTIKKLSSVNLHAVDVNSKFEDEPGMKNIERLKRLKELL